jgi:hypothetical protein
MPENSAEKADEASLDMFNGKFKRRLHSLFASGHVMHAPQLLTVLEKLVLAFCPIEVGPDRLPAVPMPLLLLLVAEGLNSNEAIEDGAENDLPLRGGLSVELTANVHFNRSFRHDSQFALFQRRWIEMAAELPSRRYSGRMDEILASSIDIDIRDYATFALAAVAAAASRIGPINTGDLASSLGWSLPRIEKILSYVSMRLDEYRTAVHRELNGRLDWYFTSFALHPIVTSGYELIVLDSDRVLRRCVGFLPLLDVEYGLGRQEMKSTFELVRQAFADYSERYVGEALESLAGSVGVQRVYREPELKRAFPNSKIADFAVDYGDAWLVVEVSMRQISRDTANGVSGLGLLWDRDAIIKEVEQIAATITQLRIDGAALTGFKEPKKRFFPLLVLTESFPSNPIVISLIRDELRNRGILQDTDTANLEIIDIEELDMIEGAVERGSVALPEMLELKSRSNFWSDSVRNFLIGTDGFDPRRPRRVDDVLHRFIDLTRARLNADVDHDEGTRLAETWDQDRLV